MVKYIKVAGLIMAQALFIRGAYESRGYFAVGGEYLILPLIYWIKILVKDIQKELQEG